MSFYSDLAKQIKVPPAPPKPKRIRSNKRTIDHYETTQLLKQNHADMEKARKKEILRLIRLADKVGGKAPYDLRTLIESGVSVNVIRRVYRGHD